MKTRKLLMTAIGALVLAVFIGGCKDDNVEIVGVCPAVLTTNPEALATNVPLDKIITVTFNEGMNPATITPAAFTLTAPVAKSKGITISTPKLISGTLTYDGSTNMMSFVPAVKLISNTTYTGVVASTIKDLMGNYMQEDYTWTFSTGAVLSPTVVSTDPANLAVNVVLNKSIKVTFSQAMNSSSITATSFKLKAGTTIVPGTVTHFGMVAIFKPTSNLISGTNYTATITTDVKDQLGNPLKANYEWTFSTGTVVAPTVISTDPVNLATGVAFNKVLSATFSEAMNASTITASTFMLMVGSTVISGVVNYSGNTATFTPTNGLLSGNTYTATITTGVTNVAGISIANDYEWTFSTVATLGPIFVDLKSVEEFGIIAGVGVSNDAGFSEIHDLNVGIYPGTRSSITGFPPAIIVNGAMYASDDIAPAGVAAMLLKAKNDLVAAYLFAEGATSPAPATVSGDQGGTTLAPGIYKSTSTLLIQSGNLTLDAQGDKNAVWIFQIASDLTTVGGSPYPSAAGGNIILSGGAQAKNVFWQVGRSATVGDFTSFKGNILALTSITMNAGSKAEGRMLCQNGAIVMTSTNIITRP